MKFIEVEWKDACSKELETDALKYYEGDGTELLETNKTYGKLFKVLDKVIIIITEESSTSNTEITVIPRCWIVKPKRLKNEI